jgi:hypothetical protein
MPTAFRASGEYEISAPGINGTSGSAAFPNHMAILLHQCLTKATTAEGDQRRHGPNWLLSRRGTLRVFDDHLECGDWRIELAEIRSAILFSFRSTFLRIPGYILSIETPDRTFHFGLNWGSYWKGELPFPVRRERGKLSYTWFSLLVRLVLVAYVAYLVWHWLQK